MKELQFSLPANAFKNSAYEIYPKPFTKKVLRKNHTFFQGWPGSDTFSDRVFNIKNPSFFIKGKYKHTEKREREKYVKIQQIIGFSDRGICFISLRNENRFASLNFGVVSFFLSNSQCQK